MQIAMAETKYRILYKNAFFMCMRQELEFKKRLEEFGG